MNNWTLVEDRLPLEEYRGQGVLGEYLVTVILNGYETDPNDEPEVMLLYFHAKKMCFSKGIGDIPYEDWNPSWHVVAWMEKPKPYKVR